MQKNEIRERLAEIIWDVDFKEMTTVWCGTARNAAYVKADWMMERGATIADDTNVPTNDVSDTDFGKWIPVSERLPDVYIDEWGDFIPFLVCEKGTEYPFRALYDGKSWGDGLCVLEPTHWMPLPKPPKEET